MRRADVFNRDLPCFVRLGKRHAANRIPVQQGFHAWQIAGSAEPPYQALSLNPLNAVDCAGRDHDTADGPLRLDGE